MIYFSSDLINFSLFVQGLSILFCYPGDDIPDYFISHDSGTTINIDLPPNWCDANFLGFAFCFVLDLSEVACEKSFDQIKIECAVSFITNDGDLEYRYRFPVKWNFKCSTLNSGHVLILYDHDLSYKMLQENFGANGFLDNTLESVVYYLKTEHMV